MVATGYPRTDKSQVIDVSSSSTACANLPSYPFAMSFAAGGVVNGSPIICGGYTSSGERTDSCHRFDRNANSWKLHSSMTSRRSSHASTVVKNALFITGGFDGSSTLRFFFKFVSQVYCSKRHRPNEFPRKQKM